MIFFSESETEKEEEKSFFSLKEKFLLEKLTQIRKRKVSKQRPSVETLLRLFNLIDFLIIFFFFSSGLPDGFFTNQKFQFGKNFQGLRLENDYIFYGHSEYFMDIWDIL
jgi:hypothetical protein